MIKCKAKVFYSYLITVFLLTILIIVKECDMLYAVLLLTWISMMFYCLNKATQRMALFCFGISYFTFLLGRDGMEYLFDHEVESINVAGVSHHAYWCMLLGLIGVWISYIFNQQKKNVKAIGNFTVKEKLHYRYIRKYSMICFYVVYPIAILVNLGIAYFVIKYGYAAKFTDMRSLVENSPIFYTLSKIELLLPASFCAYMATLPSKKEFMKLVKPYIFYLVLTLGTGGRGTFILGILLIIVFMAIMQQLEPNIIWINKKKLKYLFLLVPLIAIGGTMFNMLRFGNSTEDTSIGDSFTDFFYDQGVTSTIVKNAYYYEKSIPKQEDFYILEFLHTGILARLLGNEVYQGNTIEHATQGGSFTHALGYTIMGDNYLAGRGTGTSYLAELYYDFGYIGVFLGSVVYGLLLSMINNYGKAGIFSRTVVFIILTDLLWAPRGPYSAFLSFIFAPTTIALLIFVFVGAQFSYVKYLKKTKKLKT